MLLQPGHRERPEGSEIHLVVAVTCWVWVEVENWNQSSLENPCLSFLSDPLFLSDPKTLAYRHSPTPMTSWKQNYHYVRLLTQPRVCGLCCCLFIIRAQLGLLVSEFRITWSCLVFYSYLLPLLFSLTRALGTSNIFHFSDSGCPVLSPPTAVGDRHPRCRLGRARISSLPGICSFNPFRCGEAVSLHPRCTLWAEETSHALSQRPVLSSSLPPEHACESRSPAQALWRLSLADCAFCGKVS